MKNDINGEAVRGLSTVHVEYRFRFPSDSIDDPSDVRLSWYAFPTYEACADHYCNMQGSIVEVRTVLPAALQPGADNEHERVRFYRRVVAGDRTAGVSVPRVVHTHELAALLEHGDMWQRRALQAVQTVRNTANDAASADADAVERVRHVARMLAHTLGALSSYLAFTLLPRAEQQRAGDALREADTVLRTAQTPTPTSPTRD